MVAVNIQSDALMKQALYWKEQLSGAPFILELPTDKLRPAVQSFRGETEFFKLPNELLERLKALGRQEQTTLFMILEAGFSALLHRYTGQDDILVGTPISGRTHSETENLIGYFLNTVVLRAKFTDRMNFRSLLQQVRERAVGAYAHPDLPFEHLVAELAPERDPSRTPLFQVMFIVHNPKGVSEVSKVSGNHKLGTGTSKFDLTLLISETGNGLEGLIEYSTDLFEAKTIRRMCGHYATLLEAISRDPDQSISRLPMLTDAERQQLLVDWNDTKADYPKDVCIHQLFEAQVESTPDAIAVILESEKLTYRELNYRANQLAHYLLKKGVKPDTLVAICMERSLDMIVGIIGILKAGGAYVPLDPNYPLERLAFVLKDTQSPLLLTQQQLVRNLPQQAEKILCIDADWKNIAQESKENPSSGVAADHLAYIIYTSGSTGNPKGVLVSHKNLVHSTSARFIFYQEPVRAFLLLSSFSFDSSIAGIFWTLCQGGLLCFPRPGMEKDLPHLARIVFQHRVSHWLSLPSLYSIFLSEAKPEQISSLKAVIVAGEACPKELVDHHKATMANTSLFNEYGPTETSVWCSVYECSSHNQSGPVSIGRPIPNTQIYLLDSHLNPVPIGVSGELYVGGLGVTRGYLNHPDLTADRFIPNPFDKTGSRVYKTGDLARYRPDGNLEFLGRADGQVKIRGFRIELGEIEATLDRHPAVRQGVVVVTEDATGDKRLVAYLVPNEGQTPPVSVLRDHLREKLPEYMVPNAYVMLEKFPLTPSGKIDRRALPLPNDVRSKLEFTSDNLASSHDFVRPYTETEMALVVIWTELLKVENIGINDDFFDLGGHSLLAIKAVSRIRDVFDVDLHIQTLFEIPTISGLSKVLTEAKGSRDNIQRIKQRKNGGPCSLAFAQEQLWFLDQFAPGSPVYNIVDEIRIDGKYDAEAMKRAMKELMRRHEVLRTAFSHRDGQPMQIVLPSINLTLPELDLSSLPEQEREREWIRVVRMDGRKHFDLSQPPLFRGTMVHLSPQEHRLLLTIHHIIADEWSMDVIHREVNELYEAFSHGRPSTLPELPIQYADFACWQRDFLQGEVLERRISYWKEELSGAPFILELPTDKLRPAVQSFRGATEFFKLPNELLERLKALGRQEQTTLFMILEAGFSALLHRYTGQDDILVGTPISGRTHSETENLIGYFLNTVVLRAKFTDRMNFRSLLQQVRERAVGAYAHPDLPFEHLVAELAPERDPSRTPLFQVMFIVHNPKGVSEVSKVSGNHKLGTGTSKFDLTLLISETGNGLEGLIEYSTDLFEAKTIRRMCGHYGTLLEAISRDPDQSISRLPMLTDAERQQLLVDWNDTAVAFPLKDHCLHQLIEDQARRTPYQIALVFEQQTLTYRELIRRADRLAHYLRGLGVGPDVLVGLFVERSLEMVVALLGILKAGGAYVPLDPSFPPDRLSYMVEDSRMQVLVTHRDLDQTLPVRPPSVVHLDSDWEEIEKHSIDQLTTSVPNPGNLAYVLYTSGSTGKPKGVAISHSAIVNFLLSMQREPGLTATDTLLAVTTLSFDIAGLELYLPLVRGGKVVIASRDDTVDPQRLMERMRNSACTVMQATPAAWRALVDAGWSGSANLKLLCGGEAMPPDLAKVLLERCAELWNMYGPTETTVWSTMQRITSADGQQPIGRPIANTQVYVLNAHRDHVPPGVVGELYIGGDGLARGYLHRAELTQERFVPSPFVPNSLLYRTGDLARWLPDGRLVCLGRIDNQVKVRGFRIELGEIEVCIARHPSVREVAVIAREAVPGDKRLVAYIVAENPPADLADQLRALAGATVPAYMVPNTFVMLEKFPLTPNCKIDRRSLPSPNDLRPECEPAYLAPRTETERTITTLCQEVLHLEKIGVNDNFFHLGGSSLSGANIITKINNTFKVKLPVIAIFQALTVSKLALVLEKYQAGNGELIYSQKKKIELNDAIKLFG